MLSVSRIAMQSSIRLGSVERGATISVPMQSSTVETPSYPAVASGVLTPLTMSTPSSSHTLKAGGTATGMIMWVSYLTIYRPSP